MVGGLDPQASEIAAALYGSIFHRTVPVSSPAAAEMTKLLENIYRCVNIALVNELKTAMPANGHRYLGGDRGGLDQTVRLPSLLSRAGTGRPLHPGRSFLSFMESERVGLPHALYRTGRRDQHWHAISRDRSHHRALNQQKKAVNGSKVLVLGVAYKKDIDDLRESPALTIIELLQKEGAQVSYNDPYFPDVGRGRKYDLQMKCAPLDNLGQYDCVLIVTDHSDYDYKKIVNDAKLVVDTRNATRGIKSDKVVHC